MLSVLRGCHPVFSKQLHQFIFPQTVHKEFNFSTSSPFAAFFFFDNGHSDGCKVVSHCGFCLHLAICLLQRNVCSSPLPTFKSEFWLLKFLIYSGY